MLLSSDSMKSPFFALLALWLFIAAIGFVRADEATKRTWTSTEGRTIEASFVGMEGENIRLRLANGTVATVPLIRLSPADVEYAKSLAKSTETPETPKTTSSSAPAAVKEWPRSIDIGQTPVPEIVKEDSATKEFIYRSGHYEFHCDSKLTSSVVREFSRIFEATYLLNASLPLDLKPSPEEGQEYFVAKLYTNREDYLSNGGMQGSAGVYSTREKALSAPLASLGVKISGSRVLLDNSGDGGDNATLIHEITHQMMNHWLRKLQVWFIEGSAEAMEMLDYNRGKFNLSNRKSQLKGYLHEAKEFTFLDPSELFGLDSGTWAGALTSSIGQGHQNYRSAGLMVYYFYYLDGAGDSAHVIAYLRELEGVDRRDAEPTIFEKHLLRGRNTDQLKEDIVKAFRGEGITVSFDKPGKNSGASESK